jgi:hypothetical protein
VIHPGSFEAVVQAAVQAALAENEERLRNIIREELARTAPVQRLLPTDADEMVTTADAAGVANCSDKTIRRACAAGALPASKPKGMSEWRIRVGDLRIWVAGGRMTTPAGQSDPEVEGQRAAGRMLAGR